LIDVNAVQGCSGTYGINHCISANHKRGLLWPVLGSEIFHDSKIALVGINWRSCILFGEGEWKCT
jgi:hypothetical protein